MAIIPKPFKKSKPRKLPFNPRRRILAQWRGVDVEGLEKSLLRASAAADLMPKVLKELRMDRRQAEAEVLKVWNNLIDPSITAHAQPTGLNRGTLYVSVDSSVWLSEIVRYKRKEILERLQHGFGTELIARISFRLG